MTDSDRRPLKFDLHVHTRERSSCASESAADVLRLAALQGLDGIVFTDHGKVWPPDELLEVRRKSGCDLMLLSGQEVTFLGIDFLIYGWDGDPGDFDTREDFVAAVHQGGGVAVVAHPYSILYYLDAETMASWGVDGVEIFNSLKGGASPLERKEARDLNLAEVAGSDFHRRVLEAKLGTCWTEVEGVVSSIEDLASAIRGLRTSAFSEMHP